MINRLKDKTALVTGASAGIGRAIAYALAEAGVHLVITGRRVEILEKMARDIEERYAVAVVEVQMDVRDRDDTMSKLDELLKKYEIDILINNAGLALGLEPIDEGDISQWEQMIDTNIKGLLYVTKAVSAQMRERNRVDIINMGSIAGETAYPGGNVYCATKAAVHMLTEAMNSDFYGTNIRVGTIAPGAVDTEFSDVRFGGDKSKRDAVYEGYEPLTAEDIAEIAIFMLNSPKHVNIQHIRVMPTAQRNPFQLYRESK